MPCHLISDAHEWINEIHTVPHHVSSDLCRIEFTTFIVVVLNLKAKRFVQARVNGGSNYDSLKVAKGLVR
jgi:hypothetical protein